MKEELTDIDNEKLKELIEESLMTDGGHHKQWYTEEIARELGIDISKLDYEKGIPP